MNHDLIANLHVCNVFAYGVNNAGSVGPSDVKVLRLAAALSRFDDVDGGTKSGPHVVVIHAGCHDIDEGVVGPDFGYRDDFCLEGVLGVSEPILADDLCVHLRGYVAQRGRFAEWVEIQLFLNGHESL